MSSKTKLIIGFGTGRSGTTSLSGFLNLQKGIHMFHEGKYNKVDPFTVFHWSDATEEVLAYVDRLLQMYSTYQFVGDVGMYFFNYIEAIIQVHPDAKFICMRRSKNKVVKSYLKWTKNRNHWMVHDGLKWEHDRTWDPVYPKFDTKSKRRALKMYWNYYHFHTKNLMDKYPDHVMMIDLSEFNTIPGKHRILDFISYSDERKVNVEIKENSWRSRNPKNPRAKFWALKRKLVGVIFKRRGL